MINLERYWVLRRAWRVAFDLRDFAECARICAEMAKLGDA